MKSLGGRVAVITGVARGIGLDYALRIASLSAAVAVADHNLESALGHEVEQPRPENEDLKKTMRQFGTDVLLHERDSSDHEQTPTFAEHVKDAFRVDILVCNAGGDGDLDGAQPSELGAANIAATFARNLYSTIYTVTAFTPMMKIRGSGKIITIGSYAATTTLPGARASEYAAAKRASTITRDASAEVAAC